MAYISTKTKLYSITFKNFTNYAHDTVSNNTDSYILSDSVVDKTKFLDVSEPLIVKEDDIMKYKEFGIDSVKYIGMLLEDDPSYSN